MVHKRSQKGDKARHVADEHAQPSSSRSAHGDQDSYYGEEQPYTDTLYDPCTTYSYGNGNLYGHDSYAGFISIENATGYQAWEDEISYRNQTPRGSNNGTSGNAASSNNPYDGVGNEFQNPSYNEDDTAYHSDDKDILGPAVYSVQTREPDDGYPQREEYQISGLTAQDYTHDHDARYYSMPTRPDDKIPPRPPAYGTAYPWVWVLPKGGADWRHAKILVDTGNSTGYHFISVGHFEALGFTRRHRDTADVRQIRLGGTSYRTLGSISLHILVQRSEDSEQREHHIVFHVVRDDIIPNYDMVFTPEPRVGLETESQGHFLMVALGQTDESQGMQSLLDSLIVTDISGSNRRKEAKSRKGTPEADTKREGKKGSGEEGEEERR